VFLTRRRLALFLILLGITTSRLARRSIGSPAAVRLSRTPTKFLIVYPAIRANCKWFGPEKKKKKSSPAFALEKASLATIETDRIPKTRRNCSRLLKKHNRGDLVCDRAAAGKNIRELAAGNFARRPHAGQSHPDSPALFF